MAALGFLWGNSYLLTTVAVREIPPVPLVIGRHVFAALFLLPVLVHRLSRTINVSTSLRALPWPSFLVMGLIGSFLPFVSLSWGQESASSGLAALLSATVPLLTVVMSAVIALERIDLVLVVGIVVSFIGAVFVSASEISLGGDADRVAALAIASIFFAASSVYSRKYLSKLDPLVSAVGQMVAIAVPGLCIAWFLTDWVMLVTTISVRALLAWIALGILSTGFAYVLFHSLARDIGPSRLSSVSFLVAMVGTSSGALLLSEPFGVAQVVGTVLLLSGLAISQNARPALP